MIVWPLGYWVGIAGKVCIMSQEAREQEGAGGPQSPKSELRAILGTKPLFMATGDSVPKL
jgi:hypothetical protein